LIEDLFVQLHTSLLVKSGIELPKPNMTYYY